jgi:four helix bundle protein
MGIVAEEADETILWLELLIESEIVSKEKCGELLSEAHQLAAIFTASQQTARKAA